MLGVGVFKSGMCGRAVCWAFWVPFHVTAWFFLFLLPYIHQLLHIHIPIFFSWVACCALPSASEVLAPLPLVTVHVCAAGKFHRRTCPQLSVIRTWIWHLFLINESLDSPHNMPITISNPEVSYWEPSCSESVWFWKERAVKIILGDCDNEAPLVVSFWRTILYLIGLSKLTC